MTNVRTARSLAGLLAASLILGLSVCSGDDPPDEASDSDTSAAAEEQVCADWAQVQANVTALTDIEVVADGTDALHAATDDVSGAVQELGDSAGDQVGEEVDALGTAVDDLGDELQAVTDGTSTGGAGSGMVAVGQAIQGVATAANALGTELQPGCET
jgi:hypothetical protein